MSAGGNVKKACELSGMARSTVYRLRKNDPAFASVFSEAFEEGIDALEDEARRRAFEGVERPVFYQGKQCGAIREYSDTLLMFLLKGARPGKYRDAYRVEVNAANEAARDAEALRKIEADLVDGRPLDEWTTEELELAIATLERKEGTSALGLSVAAPEKTG